MTVHSLIDMQHVCQHAGKQAVICIMCVCMWVLCLLGAEQIDYSEVMKAALVGKD